jgi:flagellar protein FliO/FliZ
MQWLNELPFADNRVLQIGFLLACGIAALIVLALVYRLAFAHRLRVPGGRTRQPRLGLVDAFSLDGQRQLVLVRRDNVEHLVMIGGPNDVLVESQINRAAVPGRENTQASPLLVPSAPVRQVPVPTQAVPEAPAPIAAQAPVAAKVPVSPPQPAAAPVVPKAPTPVQPSAPAPTPASVPASAQVSPLTPTSAPPPKPVVPEQPRPLAASQPPKQAAEPVRSAPASSQPQRQAEPRPARPAMPPPIVPTSAAANRATARAPEQTAPRGAGNPPAPSPAAPAMPRGSEKPEPAVVKRELAAAGSTKTEPVTGPTVTVHAATATLAQAPPAPKAPPSSPTSDGPQKMTDTRAPADKTTATPSAKPPLKVDDPFADLDSLESEMARLLGREKSD